MRRSEFKREGLGYRMVFPDVSTTFTVDRLRVSSGEIRGLVMVRSEMAGARTYADNVVHYSQETLSSSTTRRTLGKILVDKIPTDPQVDWTGMYDEFCTAVMLADRMGSDPDEVGTMPANDKVHGLLIEPIVPLGVHSILFGPGGLGKSITAVALAVSLETGREIIPGFKPLATGTTLYLNWETTRDDIDARVKSVCAGAGIRPIRLFHLPGNGRPLAQRVEHIARAADKVGASMLVVDSNAKAIGTSGEGPIEDSANRFASALDEIGRSALCIDHVSKAGMSGQSSGPYGSVMKSNWARATWELTQSRPPEDGETHLVFHHRKHNTTAEHSPIGLVMRWDRGAVTWEPEDVGDATTGLSYGASLADQIAASLAEHPMRPFEIAKATGISDNMVRSILSQNKRRFVKSEVTGDYSLV